MTFNPNEIIQTSKQDEAPFIMIFAPQGHGKSAFLESARNPFIFDTENKFKFRPGKVGKIYRPKDLGDIQGALKWILDKPVSQPGDPNKPGIIALDTIDWCEKQVHEKILADYPKATNIVDDKIKDLNFQKGYDVACNIFLSEIFKPLNDIREKHNIPIVFTAQCKEYKYNEADKHGEYYVQDVRVQERLRFMLSDMMNAKLYLQKKEYISEGNLTSTEERYLICRRCRGVNAKNNMYLPEEIPISFNYGWFDFVNQVGACQPPLPPQY